MSKRYFCKEKRQLMRAIEISSKTDRAGLLTLNYRLRKADAKVRVILLLEDEDNGDEDEMLRMKAASVNPSFDFLNDPAEDIYTLAHGEPLDD